MMESYPVSGGKYTITPTTGTVGIGTVQAEQDEQDEQDESNSYEAEIRFPDGKVFSTAVPKANPEMRIGEKIVIKHPEAGSVDIYIIVDIHHRFQQAAGKIIYTKVVIWVADWPR